MEERVKVTVIILSRTNTKAEFQMTKNCISSLIDSEESTEVYFEIILVESNKDFHSSDFEYPEFVKVIIPDAKFNFHKYLNIGIKQSTGTFVALCNNDLIFKQNWMTAILKIKVQNPEILSFCPVDPDSPYTNSEKFNGNNQEFIKGYEVRTHIAGWCLVANKKLFDIIGFLDERFDFYYADDDYAMTLRKNNISHALVLNSEVKHLGGVATKNRKEEGDKTFSTAMRKNIAIPAYIYQPEHKWLLNNKKMLLGHLKFHQKWGAMKEIALKNRLFYVLSVIGQDQLIKWLYSTNFSFQIDK